MIENLDYYKVFYYVAKEGGITQAAKILSVSQPAVSQIVHQLEQLLQVTLFTRAGKGIRLTREGEVLYSFVESGYEQIEQGVKYLNSMKNMEAGEIRIGASDMTLQFFLLEHLELFHEKYPKIKVSVTNAPTPDTLKSLEAGSIDFAVVSTPFAVKKEYEIRDVRKIRDVFVAGRRFLSCRNREISYKELEKMPLICLEEDTSSRRYIDDFMEKNGVKLAPEFELATSDMIVQFAMRNLGIGCVVEDFARTAIERGDLFVLTFKKQLPSRNISVVYNEKFKISGAARNMLSLLIGEEAFHDSCCC